MNQMNSTNATTVIRRPNHLSRLRPSTRDHKSLHRLVTPSSRSARLLDKARRSAHTQRQEGAKTKEGNTYEGLSGEGLVVDGTSSAGVVGVGVVGEDDIEGDESERGKDAIGLAG